jgi:hypothetical protein
MTGPLALVYPAMAQVLLTFVLLLWSGQSRVAAVRARRVRMADVALSSDAWPEEVRKVGNNLRNQFETPVLFYVLCGVATYVAATNVVTVLLAWAYVGTRLVHTFIHVTSNRIEQRFAVFVAGVAVLIALWVAIVVKLLAAS